MLNLHKIDVMLFEQVEEMQKSLAIKSQELQQKNEAAYAKLKQMFKDQQEAEKKKKVQTQEIQHQLAEQTVKIRRSARTSWRTWFKSSPQSLMLKQVRSFYHQHHLAHIEQPNDNLFIFYDRTGRVC